LFTVIYSLNPPKSANNWANVALQNALNNPDALVHHSTYLDVPPEWLGSQFIREANRLKETKPRAYDHELMGEVTGTGGQVFDNVTLRAITNEEISHFANHYRGLDFGYAVDPTCYLAMDCEKALKRLYVYHEYYKQGAKYDAIAEAIRKENATRGTVTADSAEPRSIAELQDRGINIIGAQKGQGSVEHGVKFLQDLDEIIIDPARCPNAAREFTGYEYVQDRHGNFRADFSEKDNHTIDAARYACERISKGESGPSTAISVGRQRRNW
jgi:PBSX family phage terminase large subunit